jgi:Ser-tRNA(Ala) deacylase AlaX
MQPTKLLYLEDFNLTTAEAKVLEVTEENGKTVVLLDQTVFYPQGGGQPYDRGIIESSGGKFLAEEVRFLDGIVRHIGRFENGAFRAGDVVRCSIDKDRRALNSRLHSAGHVVDMAVTKLGLPWIPGKGYHFPEGPYVEYAGSLNGLDKEKLKNNIEISCNEFIAEARETKVFFMDKEKMKEVCRHVPGNIPEGKPARVVMYGDFGVPCGGTHASNLKEIGTITIRKIKSEGANVRVAYDIIK